ncbi:oxidoreductase family protein [Kribbella amoyensis]|uniref:Oxidoreductase family protein n=1 Tax=Kribbella amoyensis TaxID=996641 RepID=A0A561B303_9ACTN|nr:Gfo/Idh/MocA family oxidoreductase [Kribbella amoyensis]TWD73212.1 oxidoreductase family protein [Kribbella amoyensis]
MTSGGRVALVELDTSHPAAFVPLLRELGREVTAVLDSGVVRPAGYAEEFAAEYGVARVLTDAAELPEVADVALLLGCDWDRRYRLALNLLDAGTAVLLDKPLAGRVGDLRELARRAEAGQPISGGSSLRCAPEAVAWRRRYHGPAPSSVLVGCAGHPFYYGVHAVSLAQAVLGPGFTAARALDGSGLRGLLRHTGGTEVVVDVRPPRPGYPYHATIVTESGVEHLRPNAGGLYKPFLGEVLGQLLDGAAAPYSPTALVEPDLLVLAVAKSAADGGDWVAIDALDDVFSGWDGAEFAAAYRAPAG